MDWTQILVTTVVTLFSGSGFIVAMMNYKNNKNKLQETSLNEIKESIEAIRDISKENGKDIREVSEKVKAVNTTLSNLTRVTLRVDRAMSNAISTIIQALEDNHINGEGKEARKILQKANEDIDKFQESLIEERFNGED